jgi:murein L,D-transpeptidase YcbB/YkuD
MRRSAMGLVVLMVIVVSLASGCATAPRQKLENQDFRNQIMVLQQELQQKDAEIVSLRQALVRKTEEKAAVIKEMRGKNGGVTQPSISQIQAALKNAGFYAGTLDGHSGSQTRSAVKEFQKANKLTADGKVGKQTWKLLEPYLYQSAQ